MIVGRADVSLIELEKRIGDFNELCKYIDSLVPEDFRHVQYIMDNQRYVCALVLRNLKGIPFREKKELIEQLMRDIRICGYTDNLIEVQTLFGLVSLDKLQYYRGRKTP